MEAMSATNEEEAVNKPQEKKKWAKFSVGSCECMWSFHNGEEKQRGVLETDAGEIHHGAQLKACAANQLQSVPHPYKDSLMWARPLKKINPGESQGFLSLI